MVETGTHEELLEQSGKYQAMVALQTSPIAPPVEEPELAAL